MRTRTLLARNLVWYWRTNLAVVLGVATAVGVLSGALVVGDSVRASLRELFLARVGNADYAVTRAGFFREQLASAFPSACPLISLEGLVTHQSSGRRAGSVQVYGVDQRFWNFRGYEGKSPHNHEILLSSALMQELGARPGDTILLRVAKPAAIPLESLHGRREDLGKTLRFTAREAAGATTEFSIRPQQGAVRAVFVSLDRLQADLGQKSKANMILVSGNPPVEKTLREQYTLEDLGIKLRVLEKPGCISLENDSTLLADGLSETAMAAASELSLTPRPIFAYLANTLRIGDREIPYSVIAAIDAPATPPDGITLNAWAARELRAKVGDRLTLEYYVWKDEGRLGTASAQFQVTRILPMENFTAEGDLVPEYPGITEAETLREWDPPFPIDLKRIRPRDEEYWKQYRTTPKAFIPLARGQQLWQTRYGKLTSIRFFPPQGVRPAEALDPYRQRLRSALDPTRMGLTVFPAKAQGLEASHGSTDFGEYFVYFSFFLMASALLLTGLFFKLGVEQRLREIGTLRALGFPIAKIRSVFLAEGIVLAMAGAALGAAGALAYGGLILLGLRTWWVDAVGTRALSLHISAKALAIGAAAGIATGLACIAWTLRRLAPVAPRGLLAGAAQGEHSRTPVRLISTGASLTALVLLLAAALKRLDPAAAFFGAGTLLLIAAVSLQWLWLHSRSFAFIRGLLTLGFRTTTYRPGRSTLSIALIASATFLIISVGAFRREGSNSGTGGFPLMAESVLPLVRENLPSAEGVTFFPFRLKPGDDASCLNLYQPRNPRVLAPPPEFFQRAHFRFQDSLARSAEEKNNPWLLLESQPASGPVPAIADANSLTYALHRKLGEEFDLGGNRFRIVAALEDSIFQGEILISEKNFLRLYPGQEGYRFFLLDVRPERAAAVTGTIEDALSDYGFDVILSEARLAAFHRVENTYLSTFQTLGALGLLLGTVGLAAVLLRNVLERRRELALLRAVGYRQRQLATIVLSENALLLLLGLVTGTTCALLAIAPAFVARGGRLPVVSLGLLLVSVLVTGLVASLLATAAALRSPLLPALRSE